MPRWQRGAFVGGAVLINVVVAVALTSGGALAAVPLALLPITLLALGTLLSGRVVVLAYAALAFNFSALSILNDPLPVGGGVEMYAVDLVLLLAVSTWLAGHLRRRHQPRGQPALPLPITWPLLALTAAVALAVVRGNEHYGTSLLGQPVRLIIYAGIAVALTDVSAPALWRGITIVFYSGAVVSFFYALYYLATGGSQTDSVTLSTGGSRVLALSVSIYLVGSLVCALLNIEMARERFFHQLLHAVIASIALFGIIVSYGRTTYAALAVIVLVLAATSRTLRRSILWLVPILLPALIAIILLIPILEPTLAETFTSRLQRTSSTDINVEWRSRARNAATEGIGEHLLTGFGFGRPVRFVFLGQEQDVTGDPHNSYVYVLAGGGLLALGALIAVMTVYVVAVLRRLRRAIGVERSLLIWSLCTWFAFMVNAFYGPLLTDATTLMTVWILMLIPWAVPPGPAEANQAARP